MNSSIKSGYELGLIEFKEMLPKKSKQKFIGINARLHGDLSDNFIIDSKNKIWLLDWENSEYGDIIDELCWLLSCNDFSLDQRKIFFQEYQQHFPESEDIKFEDLYLLYYSSNLIFNICWGIDQLDMNIKQKLEPERKLRDLAKTANGWKESFSQKASSLMIKGIEKLTQKLS
jgi:thiamine kinase-like enzyme